jgi:hypothetical protein
MLAGLLRGDGGVESNSIQTVGPVVAQGQAYAIEEDAVPNRHSVDYSTLKSVPTLADLAAKYPPKTKVEKDALRDLEQWQTITNIEFVTPPKVSADNVAALRAAMQYAMTSKTLYNAFLADGNPIGWIPGATAKSSLLQAQSILKSVKTLTSSIS